MLCLQLGGRDLIHIPMTREMYHLNDNDTDLNVVKRYDSTLQQKACYFIFGIDQRKRRKIYNPICCNFRLKHQGPRRINQYRLLTILYKIKVLE